MTRDRRETVEGETLAPEVTQERVSAEAVKATVCFYEIERVRLLAYVAQAEADRALLVRLKTDPRTRDAYATMMLAIARELGGRNG